MRPAVRTSAAAAARARASGSAGAVPTVPPRPAGALRPWAARRAAERLRHLSVPGVPAQRLPSAAAFLLAAAGLLVLFLALRAVALSVLLSPAAAPAYPPVYAAVLAPESVVLVGPSAAAPAASPRPG